MSSFFRLGCWIRILVVGWTNIQPREGGLEKQQVGKPREHFTFSYLLPLSSSRSRSRRSAKKGISIIDGFDNPGLEEATS